MSFDKELEKLVAYLGTLDGATEQWRALKDFMSGQEPYEKAAILKAHMEKVGASAFTRKLALVEWRCARGCLIGSIFSFDGEMYVCECQDRELDIQSVSRCDIGKLPELQQREAHHYIDQQKRFNMPEPSVIPILPRDRAEQERIIKAIGGQRPGRVLIEVRHFLAWEDLQDLLNECSDVLKYFTMEELAQDDVIIIGNCRHVHREINGLEAEHAMREKRREKDKTIYVN